MIRNTFATLLALATLAPLATPQTSSPHLRVDQLGYPPLAPKVAIVRQPIVGYDAPSPINPPTLIEVRRTSDQSVAYAGSATSWNGGATHSASGDRVWWFDFSPLHETGSYYIHDVTNGFDSAEFDIGPNVYAGLLRAATRMYYYQRCGTPKAAPYAETGWTDAACHIGTQQDTGCRSVSDSSPSTSLDLSGGWHDAGDYNKYVNFADDALHDLLGAFEEDPLRWPDDFGLPESANGVADLLDELRYELAWILKMQRPDGSVLHKVSNTSFQAASPASADNVVRRYAPATASATMSACGVFARASLAFESQSDASSIQFGAALRSAAVAAWNFVASNPSSFPSNYDNAGFVSASAEDDAYQQEMNRLRAAVFLYRLTKVTTYRDYVDAHHSDTHLFQWTWAAPWEQTAQDALLAYFETPGATPAVTSAIRARFITAMSGSGQKGALFSDADAYRAWMPDQDHVWGSNRAKALQGWLVGQMFRLGLDPSNTSRWREAHAGYVHYFHGVNPTGFSYLTNLASLGVEQSVTEMYHSWFGDGTIWDSSTLSPVGPPPGYLVGGPNVSFAPDGAYSGPPIVPPQGQPPLKSFKDWNTSWPENSWAISECHIPYQAAYLRMLAPFAVGPPAQLGLDVVTNLTSPGNLSVVVSGAAPGNGVAVIWAPDLGSFQLTTSAWTVDLGIPIGPNPIAQLLFVGVADGNGVVTFNLQVPAGLGGLTLRIQATEAGTTPHPAQSRVTTRTLQ